MVASPKSRSSIENLSGLSGMVACDYSGTDVALAQVSRSLSCNTAGTVVLVMEDGTTPTRYMQAGIDYPWRVKGITKIGTTASMGIYAGY